MITRSHALGKGSKLGMGTGRLFGWLCVVFKVRSPQRPQDTENSGVGSGSRDSKRKNIPKVSRILVLVAIVLVVVLVAAAVRALASSGGCVTPTITWVGNANTEPDSWHTASNWDANRVPGAGDHVCISSAANTDAIAFTTGTTSVASLESEEALSISGGTLELTSATDESKVSNLTLSGGTLSGAGNLTILAGGNATWSGGHMTGTGRTLVSGGNILEPAASLSITGSSDKALREGRVLENAGTTTFSGNYIANGTGAVIENSGTFDIKGDGDLPYVYGGTKTRFENTGTLKKTSGTASTDISTSLDNDGSVEVSSGTLDLPGGSDPGASESSSGDFAVVSGTTLRFSGAHRLSGAGSSVTGTGTVSFPTSSSTVAVEDYDVAGITSISGATVDFDAPATTKTLDFSGGTLRGSAALTVPAGGNATWSGGHMTGTGKTVISAANGSEPAAILSVSGSSDKALLGGRVLENAGTTTLSGNYIANGTGAVIENSGTFDIKGDGDLPYVYGGTKTRFENTGTVKKSSGTASTDISTSLDNDGSVEVSSGTLALSGGTDAVDSADTSTGDFAAASGATLRYGGDHRLSGGGSSVSGSGTVEYSSGTTNVGVDSYSSSGATSITGGNITFSVPVSTQTLNVSGGGATISKDSTANNFNISGGTLGGSRTVSVPSGGTATWSGGHMTGTGRTLISGASGSEPAATLSIVGSSDKALRQGRVLENAGTITLSGNYVASGEGAVIENSGIFDIKGDGDIHYNYGGTKTRFENTGTLRKSSGTASTDISTSLDNDGSVEVSSGTLDLPGGSDPGTSESSSGDFLAGSGATLRFSGEHRLSGTGSSVTGTGTVSFPGSTSTIAVEDYDVAGITSISGATVDFNAPATTKTLDFSSGTLKGSGNVIIPAGGDAIWSGGHMTGAGRTTVSGASGSEPAAILSVSGSSDKALRDGRILENAGTTTFSGNYIANGTGAVIENSGIFDIKGDGDLPYVYGGTKTRFENTGILKKSSGTGTTTVSTSLDNDGSVEARSGTLELLGGTDDASTSDTSTGDFAVASGRSLNFRGDHRMSGTGSSIVGAGNVNYSGGTMNVGVHSYSVRGTTTVSGANITFASPVAAETLNVPSGAATFNAAATADTLNVSGGTASFNNKSEITKLNLLGGTLGGSGNVIVPAGGAASWSGGHMIDAGRTVISGAAGAQPPATLSIAGSSDKALREGRVLENAGHVAFSATHLSSGTGAVVQNSGTFDIRNDGDLNTNYGGTKTRFENTGTLKKTSGTASSDIGATLANTGGTVDVTSGTLNLAGGLDNFSSTGGVGRLAGGTYMIQSLLQPSVLKFTGADIDVNAATIVLDGLGSAILDQNNSNAIDDLSHNEGSFTIRSDRDLRTAGPLTNEGSVTIGTNSVLTTTGEYVQAAGSTALEDTTSKLAASGARVRVLDGVMKGLGTVEPALEATGGRVAPGLSRGILKVAGSYAQGLSGALEVEIGGAAPGTGHDQLDVGTTASLGGTLDIVTPSSFTPTVGQSFTILKCRAVACRSGQFDNVQGTNVGSGLEYQVHYNATDVTLEVVDDQTTNTNLALSATPSSLASGETMTLSGTLTTAAGGEGLSEQQVILNQKPAGASEFTQLGDAVSTDANGTFSVDNVQPTESTEYMAQFAGDQGVSLNASVSDVEMVTVTALNDAPTAADDSYSTDQDTELMVAATDGVLKNDTTTAEGTTLEAVLEETTQHGALDLKVDGSLAYTPDPGYTGEDAFTYKVNDGTADSNTARVTIMINAVEDPTLSLASTVATDNSRVVSEGQQVTNTGTYDDAQDDDNDAVSITASAGTVTQTGSDSGTWSWSHPNPWAEEITEVTITATDSTGRSSDTSFSLYEAPPSITLTAPAEGAVLGPTAMVSADATDDVGMDRVEFYFLAPGSGSVPSALSYEELVQGATPLGTDNSAPYSLNAPVPACQVLPNCYVFAVAHDKAGNHTTSELRGVTTDRTAPIVVNITPADGATGVPLTTRATATFSEAMDPSTVTDKTVTVLKAGTTTPITAKVSYDVASKTLTLVPSVILAKRTKYTVSIEGGGDTDGLAVKDVAGNELAADKAWSFTTGLK